MTNYRVPKRRHMRRSDYSRLRHAKLMQKFLADRAAALEGTAAAGFTFTTPATDAGAYAAGTLTLAANVGVYAAGTLTLAANVGVYAAGTLTLAGNAVADETVVVGSKTYTWKGSVGATADEVLVGASASDSLDNLIAAINGAAGGGSTYGSATVAHTQVSAAAGAGDTVVVTAIAAGTGGNSIATTETMTQGSWGAATLENGADETVTVGSKTYTWKSTVSTTADQVKIGASASDSIDNLIAAINGGAGSGTLYGSNTVAHTQVSAAAGAGDTMVVTAVTAGTAGNSIASTETMAQGSWGAATLANGANETVTIGAKTYTWRSTVSTTANEVKIGASASASIDNLIAAINGAAGGGTTYGSETVAHTQVTAAAGAGDTMVVTAVTIGDEGDDIATTEAMSQGSWGAATLEGGGDTILDSYFQATAHGLSVGDGPFVATSSGTLPTPLSGELLYVLSVVDADKFTMSNSLNGPVLAPQGAGSGTHTLTLAETAEAMYGLLKKHGPAPLQAATDVDDL